MSDAPVLLIHGVGSSFERNWRAPGWVDLLAEQGRDVVGVELPGHGAEVARGAPDRDAADLILERAARFAQVDAVGFSAGGFALMRAASREPGRFGRIALLAVADSGLGDAAGPGSMTADAIADVLVSDVETEDQMALVIRRLVRTAGNDPAAVAGFLRSRQPRVTRAQLAQITAEVLVVEGTADVTGAADVITESIAGAGRLQLNGVDHFAVPNSLRCIDAVLSFLRVR